MSKDQWLYLLFVLGLCLFTLLTPIAVNHWIFHEADNVELSASVGLLVVNFGFFVGFSRLNSSMARRLGISFGLLLVACKLFVNTFTIFLFIGLQAVRTDVFVCQFFAGYSVLLVGGVIFLHWNSKRF